MATRYQTFDIEPFGVETGETEMWPDVTAILASALARCDSKKHSSKMQISIDFQPVCVPHA